MADSNMFFNGENITKLIKSIFKEEFEIEEKSITQLISGNFKITMEEIKNHKIK